MSLNLLEPALDSLLFSFGLLLIFSSAVRFRMRKPIRVVLIDLAFGVSFVGAFIFLNALTFELLEQEDSGRPLAETINVDPDGDGIIQSRFLASMLYKDSGALFDYLDEGGVVKEFRPTPNEMTDREEWVSLASSKKYMKGAIKNQLIGIITAVCFFAFAGLVVGGRKNDA